jgi:predicted ABC-type ATPase
LLKELDRLASAPEDFAFETTMSGHAYLGRLKKWRGYGYRIEMIFLKLDSMDLAMKRIELRFRNGGHDVPQADVRRRFMRGWANFDAAYKGLADHWAVYGNTTEPSKLIQRSDE